MHVLSNDKTHFVFGGLSGSEIMMLGGTIVTTMGAFMLWINHLYWHPAKYFYVDGPLTKDTLDVQAINCIDISEAYCIVFQKRN